MMHKYTVRALVDFTVFADDHIDAAATTQNRLEAIDGVERANINGFLVDLNQNENPQTL